MSFKPIVYPTTRKCDQVDIYHGVRVEDPYRWLEDPDSAETRAWVEAQNAATFSLLDQLTQREHFVKRLTELWDYEKHGLPFKRGRRWFFFHNTGLQNQNVLYTTWSLNGGKRRVLLDPNTLSTDGTVSLGTYNISRDGKLLAYGVNTGGSDWTQIRVRDIATGKDLPDRLDWVKFSGISFSPDHLGFFYCRYDKPDDEKTSATKSHKLCYHKIGTPQSDDVVVFERPDQPEWYVHFQTTEDGRYLIIDVSQGTSRKNGVFYKDISQPDSPVVELFPPNDAQYGFIENDGTSFWFQTDKGAPLSRVVSLDIAAKVEGEAPQLTEIIGECESMLESVSVLNNLFVCSYLKDAHSQVKLFELSGKASGEIELPGIASVGGFGGKRRSHTTYYSYSGFTTPGSIYRLDLRTRKSTLFFRPKVNFDPDQFTTEQVFFPSTDGTMVPMFVSYRKDLMKKDGTNPGYYYAYGSHGNCQTPGFAPSLVALMELGFVYCLSNIRGGGEYGMPWRDAAAKTKKQTSFDDYRAGGRWLKANRYVGKIAASGGSSGGLLMAGSTLQEPDLFSSVTIHVGTLDMVRFPKFTAGWGWKAFYGDPEKPDEFAALFAYSPVHNVKPAVYPPILMFTGDHDDRVVPAHSYKFVSAMQAAQAGTNPIVIRIDTNSGHGHGKPTAKLIAEGADKYAFICEALGVPVP
jgi:prolyl oligopeptidase